MGTRFGIAIFLSLISSSPEASAWDGHHQFTRYVLKGFKEQAPAIWKKLNEPVRVTSMESFLERVLGPTCTWDAAKDNVLEGVGKEYKVYYTEGIRWRTYVDLRTGSTWIKIAPTTDGKPDNTHAVGRMLSPIEILSVYSDEPDWLIDDDVPRLKGKGLVNHVEGAGTRILRHFWWDNEPTVMPIEFDKDQETDRRMQLFYELALVAFQAGDPYWGYRFLGNSMHYLQDMTQPFHAQAIVNDDMVNTISLWRAVLCEFSDWASDHTDKPAPEHCKDLTVASALLKSAKVIGLYHAMYEDFVRGVLDAKRFGASSDLMDARGYTEAHGDKAGKILPLPAPEDGRGLTTFMGAIPFAQEQIRPLVAPVATDIYKTFTNKYRYHEDALDREMLRVGQPESWAYRLPQLQMWEQWELDSRVLKARGKLIEKTGFLMSRLGVWSRQFLKVALSELNPRQKAAVADIRTDMIRACAAGPNQIAPPAQF